MKEVGKGTTVRRTSLVSVQPLFWTTVRRRVAVCEDTCAVVVRRDGESIVTAPATTLQVVVAMGWSPGVAWPCSAKSVVSPWVQTIWLGLALALGPM